MRLIRVCLNSVMAADDKGVVRTLAWDELREKGLHQGPTWAAVLIEALEWCYHSGLLRVSLRYGDGDVVKLVVLDESGRDVMNLLATHLVPVPFLYRLPKDSPDRVKHISRLASEGRKLAEKLGDRARFVS